MNRKYALGVSLASLALTASFTSDAQAETVFSVTHLSYDVMDRPLCSQVRLDPVSLATAPSNACVPVNASGANPDRVSKNVYDAAGQLVQVRQAVGTSLEQAYETYAYTTAGKPSDIVDANGNHAHMGYDGFDRLTLWQFPTASPTRNYDGSTPASSMQTAGAYNTSDYETYGYDANGNRTSMRKRDGRTFGYTFDALNRMTVKSVPTSCASGYACTNPAASATRSVYYAYNLLGSQTAARFDSAAGSDGVLSSYDGFGRLLSSTTTFTGTSRALSFSYDADGNRTSITYPDGQTFTTSFDGLDREKLIQQPGGTGMVSLTYDAVGRYQGAGRLGGAGTGWSYDGIGRLQSIGHDIAGTASDVAYGFAYNPASQVVSRTISNDLYAWRGASNASKSYAVNGLNQYTSVAGAGYGYDSNGNLTSDGTTSYIYDAENRLVSASNGTTLTYDPNGRLWQVAGGPSGTTQFVYDGDQLSLEYNGSGSLLRRYVHGTAEGDPLIWYEGATLANPRFYHTDHQGSIVALSDTGGNAGAVNSYDEYGVPASDNQGRFGYTGQAWLPDLGLWHYKARVYSPKLGRFLQTDPVGYKDQVNLYAYVANDPVNGRDPDGTDTVYNFPGLKIIYVPIVNMSDRPDAEILRNMRINGVDSSHTRIEVRPVLAKQIDSVSVRTDRSLRDTNPDGARRSHTDSIGGREILLAPGSGAKTEKHEFGHTLGAGDQYGGGVDAQGRTLRQDVPGSQGSLMGRGTGTTPNQQTINEISRNASTSPRNTQMTCSATANHVDCR